MSLAKEWCAARTLARLKDQPLVAVVSDGYDSFTVMYVDEPWQAFAVAWWNSAYGLSASVVLVAAAYLLPRTAVWWYDGGIRDSSFEDKSDREHRGNAWSSSSFAAAGLEEGIHYTLDADLDEMQADSTFIELTRVGKARALVYAREQIEKECAAEGKPLPWEARASGA